MKRLKPFRFLILLLICFLLLDNGVLWICNEAAMRGYTELNDFQVTRRDHPERTWEKVFFGNSVVISGYREDLSEKGYVNLGMDYGVVTDLKQMLDRGMIRVSGELVIGLNLFTLYDDFETNPSYPWHRGLLVPHSYFCRDSLMELAGVGKDILRGKTKTPPHAQQTKIYYYGSMSEAELYRREDRLYANYYNRSLADFQENLKALDSIASWCQGHGVRLRLLWMPSNPAIEAPALFWEVKDAVDTWAERRGVECGDMLNALDESCFYDTGHMNYEYGAYLFTREVDQWLN